ncbi:SLC13 family permease [Jannaschia sp. R86511]|uniref:SLC13 family permease n=1 Tax=Jannaschia sp. R86511 TaxID=3093853 RepID=UPI0036D42EB4
MAATVERPTGDSEPGPTVEGAPPPEAAAVGALPVESPTGTEKVRTTRQWVGIPLGPVLAVLVYLLLPGDGSLPEAGRVTAAIVTLVAVWWMTEALPLPATALVPIVAFPLAGVLEIGEATAAYGDANIFLFLGGFAIALAMQRWNLHRRIALVTMRAFGTRPTRLVLGIMVATAFLSMWVSNTATALMMLPIAISVLGLVTGSGDDDRDVRRFGTCLMLAVAYSASIGGLGTLIGSPPNVIMAGVMEQSYDVEVSFAGWMSVGVPLAAVFVVVAWLVLTRVMFRTGMTEIAGGRGVIKDELSKLGRMSRGEVTVAVIFVVTALLWVFRQPMADAAWLVAAFPFVAQLSDAGIAMAAVVALFLVPVSRRRGVAALDWPTVQRGVPWGVLLLFGGGLAIAAAIQASGLDEWIGTQFEGLAVLPTVLLVAAVTLGVLLLTEITSNTATAATFLPVLAGVATGIGVDPLLLLLPAAMAATCAFMLPVGTPPNAIVFGTGRVTIGEMLRAGVVLNVLGVLLITAAVYLLGPWVLGIAL